MLKEVGIFEVKSGELMISDPCYELGTWCQGILDNVKNGKWIGYVKPIKAMVGTLIATHEDVEDIIDLTFETAGFEAGVDSGQLGIFDVPEFHPDNEDWYDLCCTKTDSLMRAGIVSEGGVVSCSGHGDGGYTVQYSLDKESQVVAVKVVFIDD
jgi:hypothetical protein